MTTKLVMASDEKVVPAGSGAVEKTVLKVLLALSFSHMANDTIQSLLPAIYPLLKEKFSLTFTQVGLITLTFQGIASLLQPFVGSYTDRQPKPYSLAIGMSITLLGLVLLSRATHYSMILTSAGMIGIGSSIFHPEARPAGELHSPPASAISPVGGRNA